MIKSDTNTLVLITNHFPYGLYESFLENEIPFLTEAFDRVIIIARDVTSKEKREMHGAVCYRLNPTSDAGEKWLAVRLYFKNIFPVFAYLSDEIRWIRNEKMKLSKAIISNMVHNLTKALITAYHIEKIIKSEGITGRTTLYSYWLTSSALATTFVMPQNPSIRRISRAHGGDVYETRNTLSYLSFRSIMAKKLDRIYAISTDGTMHLRKKLGDSPVIRTSRLGTPFSGSSPRKKIPGFTIVSCSFLVAVKRIDLLISALSTINDLSIHWIHIGNGPLEEDLKETAKSKLGLNPNITFEFAGAMTNSSLLEFYGNRYVDLFVNTSSSEGIPVTMMEAQSFGIPIVGPQTGGVPEIIIEGTGALFPVFADAGTIAAKIRFILSLPSTEYEAMRGKALQNWSTHYNAANNFSTFVAEISTL